MPYGFAPGCFLCVYYSMLSGARRCAGLAQLYEYHRVWMSDWKMKFLQNIISSPCAKYYAFCLIENVKRKWPLIHSFKGWRLVSFLHQMFLHSGLQYASFSTSHLNTSSLAMAGSSHFMLHFKSQYPC